MAERRVLKTWSQMEVCAVVSYERARGTSILNIQRLLQSVYGGPVKWLGARVQCLVKEGTCGCGGVFIFPTSSPTRPFIAQDSTHFHLRPRFELTSFCHTDLH
ncbi:hypothetical protein AVEN_138041-1 [Araneus ventricosus]|uniref:Mos1 transposase HTH domain-containing protein n=1 Tax=Araneus ventricosus TaxID=182803 RepID=A0A4Y2MX85_ARAVE|nr:hypothetical protein AVEN_138041-1 [Araneus ventricosus]